MAARGPNISSARDQPKTTRGEVTAQSAWNPPARMKTISPVLALGTK
jgi:hypothetical protein